MINRWDEAAAPPDPDPVAACVYVSRLMGEETTLVLHGGGNSSVKAEATDITGRPLRVLYMKGSGCDLATIESEGFPAVRLERLLELAELEHLSDAEMMNELRAARLDASAPDPSVESLLHAILPHTSVLHSHADVILALTDAPDNEARAREVFGDRAVIVPYVMPGFDLTKACARALADAPGGWNRIEGLVLLNHGLFTFGATAREAYDRHIALATLAESHLAEATGGMKDGVSSLLSPTGERRELTPSFMAVARLRAEVSRVAGAPMVLRREAGEVAMRFVARDDLADVATRGPITPDHVIRTKRIAQVGRDVDAFAAAYADYFAENAPNASGAVQMLDPAPRVVLDPELGLVTAGRRPKDAAIAREVYLHTIPVIEAAEALGGYAPISAFDAFEVEYWELEQAKLARFGVLQPLAGEVALVTGAASGIGKAIAAELLSRGAAVIGVDIDPSIAETQSEDHLGVVADVTARAQTEAALAAGVERFGGVDIAVAAAGLFGPTASLADFEEETWETVMGVNARSVARLFGLVHPLLALAPRGGRALVVGSKNVDAPGPGAAAYSASKAAVNQIVRVAALEWAKDGIRVNTVHPDGVFDTGLWTDDVIAERAAAYDLTVDEYRSRNLLGVEVTSADVAAVAVALCSDAFGTVTGAQVPVDGGNERVI